MWSTKPVLQQISALSISMDTPFIQDLSLIPKLCYSRGASRSDSTILRISCLKPALATHSFDSQRGCSVPGRIITLRAEASGRKQWELCELFGRHPLPAWQGRARQGRAWQGRAGQSRAGHSLPSNPLLKYTIKPMKTNIIQRKHKIVVKPIENIRFWYILYKKR